MGLEGRGHCMFKTRIILSLSLADHSLLGLIGR